MSDTQTNQTPQEKPADTAQTFDPKALPPKEEANTCCGACGGGGH